MTSTQNPSGQNKPGQSAATALDNARGAQGNGDRNVRMSGDTGNGQSGMSGKGQSGGGMSGQSSGRIQDGRTDTLGQNASTQDGAGRERDGATNAGSTASDMGSQDERRENTAATEAGKPQADALQGARPQSGKLQPGDKQKMTDTSGALPKPGAQPATGRAA